MGVLPGNSRNSCNYYHHICSYVSPHITIASACRTHHAEAERVDLLGEFPGAEVLVRQVGSRAVHPGHRQTGVLLDGKLPR